MHTQVAMLGQRELVVHFYWGSFVLGGTRYYLWGVGVFVSKVFEVVTFEGPFLQCRGFRDIFVTGFYFLLGGFVKGWCFKDAFLHD